MTMGAGVVARATPREPESPAPLVVRTPDGAPFEAPEFPIVYRR